MARAPGACSKGEERGLGDSVRVWMHGIQHDDGRMGDGATEAPGILVDGRSWEEGISSETARRLADLLVIGQGA